MSAIFLLIVLSILLRGVCRLLIIRIGAFYASSQVFCWSVLVGFTYSRVIRRFHLQKCILSGLPLCSLKPASFALLFTCSTQYEVLAHRVRRYGCGRVHQMLGVILVIVPLLVVLP